VLSKTYCTRKKPKACLVAHDVFRAIDCLGPGHNLGHAKTVP
jgi:hypothetical protein